MRSAFCRTWPRIESGAGGRPAGSKDAARQGCRAFRQHAHDLALELAARAHAAVAVGIEEHVELHAERAQRGEVGLEPLDRGRVGIWFGAQMPARILSRRSPATSSQGSRWRFRVAAPDGTATVIAPLYNNCTVQSKL
jgi:hypothetical protein